VVIIAAIALVAAYTSLFSYTRVDGYLFPGNELALPQVPAKVPGTDIGVNVSLPGISTSGPRAWTPDDRLNILVLGLDRRPDQPEDASYRSDTMFVASIDKHAGRLQMLAVPRDMWADIPYGDEPGVWAQNKINAAYSYGQFYKYPGGGTAAAVAAVEHNFNIDVHNFVVIDWVGFVRLIDALDGIDINVPETISDFGTDVLDSFPDQTVQAGEQHMDGTQALGYSRVRVDGDLKRIDRQQLVIKAVASKSVDLGYIARLPELWEAYKDAFRTDITNAQIPGFALLARQVDLENIETFSLGGTMYGGVSEDGQLILLPNVDEMYGVIDRFLADPRVRDEAPVVTLSYPVALAEAATAAKEHLARYGVPPESIALKAEDTGPAPGIYDVTGKRYTTGKLPALLDLEVLRVEAALALPGDVFIRLGEGTALLEP